MDGIGRKVFQMEGIARSKFKKWEENMVCSRIERRQIWLEFAKRKQRWT